MITQHQLLIQASPERIFTYLMDINNRVNYVTNLEQIRLLGTPPIRVGSRYLEITKLMGRSVESIYEVTELIENQRISSRTVQNIFPIQATLELTSAASGTYLSIRLDYTLKGIYRLASGIVSGAVEQQARQILDNVKSVLE